MANCFELIDKIIRYEVVFMKIILKKVLCAAMVAISTIFMGSLVSAKTCHVVARISSAPSIRHEDIYKLVNKKCSLDIYRFNVARGFERIPATAKAICFPYGFCRGYQRRPFFVEFSYDDDEVGECFKYDFLKKLASDKSRGGSFGALNKFRYGCHLAGIAEFVEGTPLRFENVDIDLNVLLEGLEADDVWDVVEYF